MIRSLRVYVCVHVCVAQSPIQTTQRSTGSGMGAARDSNCDLQDGGLMVRVNHKLQRVDASHMNNVKI